MSAFICNKCGTSNGEGTDKCSNCGFTFANQKMNTVGKYLGDIAPKPTIVEKVISQAFYTKSKPTIIEPIASNEVSHTDYQSKVLPILENPIPNPENNVSDLVNQSLNEVKSDLQDSTSLIENHLVENSVNENSSKEYITDEKPIGDHQSMETEMISTETIKTTINLEVESENNCHKCGYILSSYSSVCPNCGHENAKVKMTMRMPDPTEISTPLDQKNQTISEPKSIQATGAYPLQSNQRESAKTVLEHHQGQYFTLPNETKGFPNAQGLNQTIREGSEIFINHEDNYTPTPTHIPEIKSPIRLEAIYLGQDGDQNMVINIPENTQNLHVNRSLIDDGDSTISSGSHAYIYKDGNEWKIENKASNKAVFLQVNNISTLKNGDIIMLGGDKFYVFIDESQK